MYAKCPTIIVADHENIAKVCAVHLSKVPSIWNIHEVANVFYTSETLVPCLASHSANIVLQILSLASACDRKLLESLMPTS